MNFFKKHTHLLFYIVPLLVVSLFWKNEIVCFVLLLIISMYFLLTCNKKEKRIFILTAILGVSMELIGIYMGAWNHAKHFLPYVPIWLPFAWGLIGLFFNECYKLINN